MIIEREFNPTTEQLDDLPIGTIFSDNNGDGLFLLTRYYSNEADDCCEAFDLENNVKIFVPTETKIVTRKARLIIED